MKFFRIAKKKHRDSAFTGEGASRYPGRWNHRHHTAVYLTGSISLAQLEILVHLREESTLSEYVLFELEIEADKLQALGDEDYPEDWDPDPPPSSTRSIGTDFLERQEALGLWVRSSVIRQEYNLLFNPAHPGAAAVIEAAVETEARFDPRLNR